MLLNFAMVILGISLLVWSADRFTGGAAAIARNLGISPLIVGLTIVAMGSSAPEIVVSINAALQETPGLAVGNAIGSNIANIGMVLSISAIIAPLKVQSAMLKRETPVLFAIMFITAGLIIDNQLTTVDGIILLTCLMVYLIWLTFSAISSRNKNDLMLEELVDEIPDKMPNAKALGWLIVGLILLQISSKLLVAGAIAIAKSYGVSDFLIGVTIVAIGTSLPELAASITGVLKGEHELALGNVVGSNIFNLLAVLGAPALIVPITVHDDILLIDYTFMFGLTLGISLMAWEKKGKPGKISRLEGGIILFLFSAYQAYKFIEAT